MQKDLKTWVKQNGAWEHIPKMAFDKGMTTYQTLFTGLQDVNGTKIYEYDIVETYNEDETLHSRFYIKYIKSQCRFNISADLVVARKAKVVGNVFQNSDLLTYHYRQKLKQEIMEL